MIGSTASTVDVMVVTNTNIDRIDGKKIRQRCHGPRKMRILCTFETGESGRKRGEVFLKNIRLIDYCISCTLIASGASKK